MDGWKKGFLPASVLSDCGHELLGRLHWKPGSQPTPQEPQPPLPLHLTPHTSRNGDPPALVVVSQGHSVALLGGYNPDGTHAVLALHIWVVARVASCQLGIDLVVHVGWGECISDSIPAEGLVLPDHDGCCEARGHLVGAGQGDRLEQDHYMVRVGYCHLDGTGRH